MDDQQTERMLEKLDALTLATQAVVNCTVESTKTTAVLIGKVEVWHDGMDKATKAAEQPHAITSAVVRLLDAISTDVLTRRMLMGALLILFLSMTVVQDHSPVLAIFDLAGRWLSVAAPAVPIPPSPTGVSP